MWVEGKWKGKGRVLDHFFRYREEFSFVKSREGLYRYVSEFKIPLIGITLGGETGFLRLIPDKEDPSSGKAELVCCQSMGICDTLEGTYNKDKIEVNSTNIIRVATATPPFTTELRKRFIRKDGELIAEMDLGSTKHATRPHLTATFTKE
eukprot:TRINITY_DN7188_c0_g1_i3.p1 TRINITY_DN7188_c0_g1~~TRINITY_DN7188_c0_g1_i3.p1  ORF type:complete len:150 (-),score=19.67 TRINITY_DN7188_c0_g1_i3:138-587(-)